MSYQRSKNNKYVSVVVKYIKKNIWVGPTAKRVPFGLKAIEFTQDKCLKM